MRLILLVCFAVLALAHMSPLEKLVEALEVSLEKEDSVACGYDYDYDVCRSWAKRATCLTDHSPYGKRASTNGKHWYQIQGSTYRVGDNCYKALTSCLNCLDSPARHLKHLEKVDCGANTKGCPERPARPTRPTRPTVPGPKRCRGKITDDGNCCKFPNKAVLGKCCERENLAVDRLKSSYKFTCCEHGAVSKKNMKHIRVCKAPKSSIVKYHWRSKNWEQNTCYELTLDDKNAKCKKVVQKDVLTWVDDEKKGGTKEGRFAVLPGGCDKHQFSTGFTCTYYDVDATDEYDYNYADFVDRYNPQADDCKASFVQYYEKNPEQTDLCCRGPDGKFGGSRCNDNPSSINLKPLR